MICCLCKEEKILIDAHIIPKWAYAYLYPEGKIKGKALLLVGTKERRNRPIGIYDSNILCSSCDSFLGTYDDYGKFVIISSDIEPFADIDFAFIIKDVNIAKFKFFLLSVIWRCSISKRIELKLVSLGPFEEKIRNIIYKAKNSQDVNLELNEFPIIMAKFGDGKYPNLVDKNIQLPFSQRIDGVNFNVLYFPRGLKIYIKTDKRSLSEVFEKTQLKNKDIIIPRLKDFDASSEFNFFMTALRGSNNELNGK